MVTFEPLFPLAPELGDCFHTRPRFDFQFGPSFAVMTDARKPACSRVACAEERDMPRTEGTLLVAGAVDTTISTVIPSAAVDPAPGVCRMTRPGA